MLQFDEKGHLFPYEIIELTLDEFEAFFVEGLEDKAHRRGLFQNYLLCLEELKGILKTPFFQWIDGSYVTLKNYPADFDMVVFVDYDIQEEKVYELMWLKAKARMEWSIDIGFAVTCPPEPPEFKKSQQTLQFWRKLYGNSRDKEGVSFSKGIILINFKE